ncbi:addiction module antidote protein [Enterovibrio norvegicus]|uniref:addiction module antidote protein n=1 Tax=Enterovibrio norvegicus TaxID=188144 RepID=UPI0024B0D0DC|nr:addiction module antidote protein [Enterovibrio norvegicus]
MLINNLAEFDPAEYLDSDEVIQYFIDEAVATCDVAFIASSLGVVAKAKGMTKSAKETGLSIECLYRALSENGNPNLKTLLAVSKALNVMLKLDPVSENPHS